jgi:hypothetical protein
MTRPSYAEKCKNCFAKFIPPVEVESLPVFNSVGKFGWVETGCPHCGFRYRVARLGKSSPDVCLLPSEKLQKRESELIAVVASAAESRIR